MLLILENTSFNICLPMVIAGGKLGPGWPGHFSIINIITLYTDPTNYVPREISVVIC
jgi:hypothetical protein